MFSRQIGLTLAAAVDELRRCGLSIVHIGDMLAASTLALGTIAANNAAPSSSMSAAVRSSDDALSSTRNPSETAFYRWRNGHHVFALFSIFCRYFLECGLNAVTRQKFDELCGHVNNATVALRGTTAAMWYAADFPRPIYEKEVRPSMETQHTPQGFSGTQNFDYERLKEARDLLHASLVNTLGRRLKRWPKDAGESYLEFKEVELEDMENHILIAAKMVGRGASMFASKDRGGDLPPAPPAVDMLRDMAAVKVQQLQALLAEE